MAREHLIRATAEAVFDVLADPRGYANRGPVGK
jgi:hypothetical protein